ncbi:MAG: hypothetical protein ABII96_09340 [Candidatus Zixiibacteriota bacterium]
MKRAHATWVSGSNGYILRKEVKERNWKGLEEKLINCSHITIKGRRDL